MRVLIVANKFYTMPFMHYEFPIGLASISAVLKKAGHQVYVLNLNEYYAHLHPKDYAPLEMLLRRKIVKHDIEVVCTGGLSSYYDTIKQVVLKSRCVKPDVITVLGGGILTSEPELIFDAIAPDFGVVGEGELTMVELLSELSGERRFERVDGIVFRDREGKAVLTAPREPIMDLDTLPYPDYEGFNVQRYVEMQIPTDLHGYFKRDNPRALPILASRSCPFKCSFCFHPIGDKYRTRSLDSIFAEIDYMVERYAINTLLMMDELFGFNMAYLVEFCRRFAEYDMDLVVQLHVSQVNEETIALLKKANTVFISFGIESASDLVLKSMNKHSTIAQIDRALELTYEAGIQIQGNFIFGDRSETLATVEETFRYWYEHRKYMINLSLIIPYPGSSLWGYGVSSGIIGDKLEYIEQECGKLFRLNLTQMTQFEFDALFSTIQHHDFNLRNPTRVLECKVEDYSYRKRALYSLSAVCPHCGEVGHYGKLHSRWVEEFVSPFHDNRLGCRKCNHRFDVLAFKTEAALCTLRRQLGNRRFGILGADGYSTNLLKLSPSTREKCSCLLDDLAGQGLACVEGIPVLALSNNMPQILKEIEVLVVLSKESHLHCHPQLSELQKFGLEIIDLTQQFLLPELETHQQRLDFINQIFEKVEQAFGQGAHAYAFGALLTVTDKFPTVAVAHQHLSELASAVGDFQVSLDASCTAEILGIDTAAQQLRSAALLAQNGEYESARARFAVVLEGDPGNREACDGLTKALLKLGRHEELSQALFRQRPFLPKEEQQARIMQLFSALAQGEPGSRFEPAVFEETLRMKQVLFANLP